MARISVVIPVFNGELFLRKALESVAAQSSLPYEIIVVDDGSTDGTKDVVTTFSSAIPVSYHHQQNQGAGAARNRGVSVARGDWIAFLDADDTWKPHKLATQVEYLQTHPEAQFVYSKTTVTDEGGKPVNSIPQPASLEPLIFGDRPFARPSTVLVRKDLLDVVGGFCSRLKIYEDLELFARIDRLAALHFIPAELTTYRLHRSQSTRNQTLQETYWPMILQVLWNFWQSDPPKQAVVGGYLAKSYGDRCKHHLMTREFRLAQRFGRLAFTHKRSIKNFRRLTIAWLPGIRNLFYAIRNVPVSNK